MIVVLLLLLAGAAGAELVRCGADGTEPRPAYAPVDDTLALPPGGAVRVEWPCPAAVTGHVTGGPTTRLGAGLSGSAYLSTVTALAADAPAGVLAVTLVPDAAGGLCAPGEAITCYVPVRARGAARTETTFPETAEGVDLTRVLRASVAYDTVATTVLGNAVVLVAVLAVTNLVHFVCRC